MTYPAVHFPETPAWIQVAITTAVGDLILDPKWQAPLECIGRYESNYRPNANLCSDPTLNMPLGIMQLARGMFQSARRGMYIDAIRLDDPVQQAQVAILYIKSQLDGYGGYGNLGNVDYTDGQHGLLSRTDRGPGDVLRYWIANPAAGVEEMRSMYHGY